MTKLSRFWFRFERFSEPTALSFGCGVTAFDRLDAETILKSTVFANQSMPKIEAVVENIEFEMLESRHVAPNIGVMSVRGVWFPQGY
jgi:hypothetical protein